MAIRIRMRAILLAAALPFASGDAFAATNQVVGLVSSEPGAALVKRFRVPAGTVVTGIEFVNNDDRSEFPKVALLRGPATRLSEAAVLAQVTNVRTTSPHRVRVSVSATALESAADLYVAVTFPASDGVRGTGDGTGIAATQLTAFGDCYIAPTTEEAFQAIDLDLAMTLLYRSPSKAGNPEETKAILQTFLSGSVPNPATSVARVQFGLDRRMPAKLAIYNASGRLVRLLVAEHVDAGVHSVDWDGKDERGQDVAAGVYITRLQAGEKVITQKLVLAK